MKTDSFRISAQFPVPSKELYQAWLDSKQHSAFTGAGAKVKAQVGGKFTAWDGYILGKTIEMKPYRRILQSWRTTDFPEGCSDSVIDITFEDIAGGTKMTIQHTEIPEGQGEEYKEGWRQFYFKPMKAYFLRKRKNEKGTPAK